MTLLSPCLLVATLLAICAPATSLLSQQKKSLLSFWISGTVVSTRDNSPVMRCSISARLSGGRGISREPVLAESDERGRFTLNLPSAGTWELTASAHNFHSQPLDGHDGYFTGIVLTSQTPSYDVVFHALPDALLTGVVTDEAGDAIRNAQVTLFSLDPEARQTGSPPMQQRQSTQTDDRGHFELAGLDSGRYLVEVQARPWYASAGTTPILAQTTSPPVPDPSLDVVYPVTWYPGVVDVSAAEILMAHPGDVLQADFHLVPQPSAHVLIPSSASPSPQNSRPGGNGPPGGQNPNVSLLLPDGSLQQVFGQVSRASNGDLDISGLAPGNYQITLPGGGPGASGRTSMLNVQGGSSTALNAASPETSVTLAVDGGTETQPSQIILVDSSTGQSFSPFERPRGGGRPTGPQGQTQRPDISSTRGGQAGPRGRPGGNQPTGVGSRGRSRSSGDGEEITFQVPAGRYDITLRGDSNAFVTGISATKGVIALGHSVIIPDGSVNLTVHLASAFATVSGTTWLEGKPSVGAMVLLVPATLGDPASLTVVRRDQTNSDGSYRLENVIPGQYILLAIDKGWDIRWTDPAILNSYLLHGTPLDLRSSTVLTSKLTALAP